MSSIPIDHKFRQSGNENIILAGVARSGSTLACYLLNKTSNVVALLEPIEPKEITTLSEDDAVSFLEDFFEVQRNSVLQKGIAKSKSTDGKVPDNLIGAIDEKTGVRKYVLDGHTILIDRNMDDNFLLVVKQPGMFTGMLHFLKYHFTCYATIRNPLAVLQSWNTTNMAVKDGHAPAAEQCDPFLKVNLEKESDVYNRQVILLSWYFEQFYKHLPIENIIYYEKVINTGGRHLVSITSSASLLDESLKNKNKNQLYNDELKQMLATRLLDSEGYYWNYYEKNDVLKLL